MPAAIQVAPRRRDRRERRGRGDRALNAERPPVIELHRDPGAIPRGTAPSQALPGAPGFEGEPPVPEPTATLVSVVIPARNEAANIAWVLQRMPSVVDEVILVDGHSTDGTVEAARRVRPDIVVVSDGERGKGEAMRTGAAAASGRFVVMLDADGSMDPAEIEGYLARLAEGQGFVKGSRFVRGGGTADMTPIRMLGNAALTVLSNLLFRSRWTDLCYGYCAFRREALEELALDADGFEIETQMVVRATRLGIPTVEVPSFEYPRRYGASQLNTVRDGFRVLGTILRERFARSRGKDVSPATWPPREVESLPASERDVSVVVCTHTAERRAMLRDLIASIAAGRLAPREIIVVVDSNPALLAELSAADWPVAVQVRASDGSGLAAARNTGWRAASAAFVAFIDDDGYASPGWLAELMQAVAEHRVDVVGGRIEPRWTSEPPAWFTPRLGWVVGCTYDGLPKRPALVRNVIGCNMLIRRAVLEQLGGFEPSLGRAGTGLAGCEETELCIRATAAGRRVMLVPGATVEQVLPSNRATLRHALRRAWDEGRSKRLIVRRHGPVIGTEARYARLVLGDAVASIARGLLTGRVAELHRAVGLVAILATTTLSYLLNLLPR